MSKELPLSKEHLDLHAETVGSWAFACLGHGSTSGGTQAETRQQDVAFSSITCSLKHSFEYMEYFLKQQSSVFLVRPGEEDVGAGADVPEDLRCDESSLQAELTSKPLGATSKLRNNWHFFILLSGCV